MKCPACDFVSSDLRDICPKCLADLRPQKKTLGISISYPSTPYNELVKKYLAQPPDHGKKSKPIVEDKKPSYFTAFKNLFSRAKTKAETSLNQPSQEMPPSQQDFLHEQTVEQAKVSAPIQQDSIHPVEAPPYNIELSEVTEEKLEVAIDNGELTESLEDLPPIDLVESFEPKDTHENASVDSADHEISEYQTQDAPDIESIRHEDIETSPVESVANDSVTDLIETEQGWIETLTKSDLAELGIAVESENVEPVAESCEVGEITNSPPPPDIPEVTNTADGLSNEPLIDITETDPVAVTTSAGKDTIIVEFIGDEKSPSEGYSQLHDISVSDENESNDNAQDTHYYATTDEYSSGSTAEHGVQEAQVESSGVVTYVEELETVDIVPDLDSIVSTEEPLDSIEDPEADALAQAALIAMQTTYEETPLFSATEIETGQTDSTNSVYSEAASDHENIDNLFQHAADAIEDYVAVEDTVHIQVEPDAAQSEECRLLFNLAHRSLSDETEQVDYIDKVEISKDRELLSDALQEALHSTEAFVDKSTLTLSPRELDKLRSSIAKKERQVDLFAAQNRKPLPAPIRQRMKSFVLDCAATMGLALLLTLFISVCFAPELKEKLIYYQQLELHERLPLFVLAIVCTLYSFILYPILAFHFFGQTLGGYLTGTRIVRVDYRKPKYSNIIVRNLLFPLSIALCGFVPLFFGKSTLHDWLARTRVVI